MPPKYSQPVSAHKKELAKIRRVLTKVPKTKDPPPARRRRTVCKGSQTKMGIVHFIFTLFAENEIRDRHRKLTDQDIENAIAIEFPYTDRHDARYSGYWESYQSVNNMRGRYNRGCLSNQCRPEQVSFRYNDRGAIVDGPHGKRLLPKEEIIGYLDYWDAYWTEKEKRREAEDDAIQTEQEKALQQRRSRT